MTAARRVGAAERRRHGGTCSGWRRRRNFRRSFQPFCGPDLVLTNTRMGLMPGGTVPARTHPGQHRTKTMLRTWSMAKPRFSRLIRGWESNVQVQASSRVFSHAHRSHCHLHEPRQPAACPDSLAQLQAGWCVHAQHSILASRAHQFCSGSTASPSAASTSSARAPAPGSPAGGCPWPSCC